jgi:hypothetical protein
MSVRPPLARLATELLAAAEASPKTPSPDEAARAITLVAQEIERQARSGQRRRRLVVSASLALCAAVVVGVGLRASRETHLAVPVTRADSVVQARATVIAEGVIVVRDGRDVVVEGGVALQQQDRIVTMEHGRASVALSTGTQLVLEGGAELTILDQGNTQSYSLRSGTVRADVVKLRGSERFLVRTADAEVEVRGTSFRVSVAPSESGCARHSTTKVSVTEGDVIVRSEGREEHVLGGQVWPPGCEAQQIPVGASPPPSASTWPSVFPHASAAPATSRVVSSAQAVTANAPPTETRGEGATRASDLAVQNELFAEATAARKRGDSAKAIATYEVLATRHPSSPLAETAVVERMRLLARSDPGRGAEAARLYLARYPRGFARVEADALAAQR